MNRKSVGTLGLFGLVGVTGAAFAFFTACGFSPPDKNPNPNGGGGACSATPGSLPAPDCDNSSDTCTGGGCPIDAKCGSPTTCLPLADNTGKTTLDFRMRRLNVAAPEALAETFVQNTVVTANIDLKGTAAAPVCGDKGAGAFNWLLQVDKTANTLKTGGAIPGDPFGAGYCFYDHTTNGGIAVAPSTLNIHFDATGNTFDTDPTPKLQVPIFLNGDINNVIVLPLSQVVMKGVTLSADDNCIGAFNLNALSTTCDEDPSQCSKWKTAGSLGGYITIEDADNVNIDILTESLCVLLSKSTKGSDNKCPRDGSGAIAVKGDYCSTTQTAGGCQDSYWLAATFAASAITINDGASTPECQGGSSTVDAGQDSGPGPVDSGTDSGTAVDAGDGG